MWLRPKGRNAEFNNIGTRLNTQHGLSSEEHLKATN